MTVAMIMVKKMTMTKMTIMTSQMGHNSDDNGEHYRTNNNDVDVADVDDDRQLYGVGLAKIMNACRSEK